jgi:hypothetical protein
MNKLPVNNLPKRIIKLDPRLYVNHKSTNNIYRLVECWKQYSVFQRAFAGGRWGWIRVAPLVDTIENAQDEMENLIRKDNLQ